MVTPDIKALIGEPEFASFDDAMLALPSRIAQAMKDQEAEWLCHPPGEPVWIRLKGQRYKIVWPLLLGLLQEHFESSADGTSWRPKSHAALGGDTKVKKAAPEPDPFGDRRDAFLLAYRAGNAKDPFVLEDKDRRTVLEASEVFLRLSEALRASDQEYARCLLLHADLYQIAHRRQQRQNPLSGLFDEPEETEETEDGGEDAETGREPEEADTEADL